MFPLGTVLLPGGLLPLRLFEPRYLALLSDVLQTDEPEIGFVLIERGHEAGGGDARFSTGTVGRIVQVEPRENEVGMVATHRRPLLSKESCMGFARLGNSFSEAKSSTL